MEPPPPPQRPSEFSEALTEVFPVPDDVLQEPGQFGSISTVVVEERGLVEEHRSATAEGTEKKSLRRRRKRHRKGRLPREAEAREARGGETREGGPMEAEAAEQPASAAAEEGPRRVADRRAGLPEGERERSKRRRSRHGGRRRKERSEPAAGVSAEQTAEDAAEEEEDFLSHEELLEDAEASAEPQREAAEEDRPVRSRETDDTKAAHRAIPTWQEAIGVIVTANLEARAKRPSTGSSRGRNGGRGPNDQRRSGRKPGGRGD